MSATLRRVQQCLEIIQHQHDRRAVRGVPAGTGEQCVQRAIQRLRVVAGLRRIDPRPPLVANRAGGVGQLLGDFRQQIGSVAALVQHDPLQVRQAFHDVYREAGLALPAIAADQHAGMILAAELPQDGLDLPAAADEIVAAGHFDPVAGGAARTDHGLAAGIGCRFHPRRTAAGQGAAAGRAEEQSRQVPVAGWRAIGTAQQSQTRDGPGFLYRHVRLGCSR